MKYNCMKKYLNDLKRNEPLWIVGQSGEKFTMSVSTAFSVSSRPVVHTQFRCPCTAVILATGLLVDQYFLCAFLLLCAHFYSGVLSLQHQNGDVIIQMKILSVYDNITWLYKQMPFNLVHSLFNGLDMRMGEVGLFLEQWSNIDEMHFLTPPVTDMGDFGNWTWVSRLWVHRPKPLSHSCCCVTKLWITKNLH